MTRGRFRPRLTFANVTSATALFVALGGGAYAATSLPANSVGTAQLRKHAVTLGKIATGAQRAIRPRGFVRTHVGWTDARVARPVRLAKVGPYTIEYSCTGLNENAPPRHLSLYAVLGVNGPAGHIQNWHVTSVDDSHPSGHTPTQRFTRDNGAAIAGSNPDENHFERDSGTALVNSGKSGRVLTINYSVVADNRSRNQCDFYGSASMSG